MKKKYMGLVATEKLLRIFNKAIDDKQDILDQLTAEETQALWDSITPSTGNGDQVKLDVILNGDQSFTGQVTKSFPNTDVTLRRVGDSQPGEESTTDDNACATFYIDRDVEYELMFKDGDTVIKSDVFKAESGSNIAQGYATLNGTDDNLILNVVFEENLAIDPDDNVEFGGVEEEG